MQDRFAKLRPIAGTAADLSRPEAVVPVLCGLGREHGAHGTRDAPDAPVARAMRAAAADPV